MLSFVRGFEQLKVPDNPVGYGELEMLKRADGSFSLEGAGWENEFVMVRFPILGVVERCEKSAKGWRGYIGDTCVEVTEDCKSDHRPGHVFALNQHGQPFGLIVLRWGKQKH